MGLSPAGRNVSGASLGGYTSGGDTRSNIEKKLSELKDQRDEFEKGRQLVSDKRAVDTKIASLDRRIETLEKRLEKLDEKNGECQTCKNRKYQDGSNDPGVSFKTATKVAPGAALAAVRGHEMEHVYRNQAKAAREGQEVVSQSVVIKSGICPECGKPYVAGGETRTVTRPKPEKPYNVGIEEDNKGDMFDTVA